MTRRQATIFAWTLCALCIVSVSVQAVITLAGPTAPQTAFDMVELFGWGLTIPILFAVPAAVIISRQPGNMVGWLMMLPVLTIANPLPVILLPLTAPPAVLTPGLWLLFWLSGWSWIPVIFPVFLIPLHFPTGRPPSPRWRWVNWLAVGMWLFFIIVVSFAENIGPLNADWTLPNPIGLLSDQVLVVVFGVVWGLGLATLAIAGVASLFVRYRRADYVEREQIKWLLYATGLFASYYTLSFLGLSDDSRSSALFDLLFVLGLGGIPVSIAIAILRYRLYDIDIIIRRTLTYALLTGILALVYFGSVVLLQTLVQQATDEQSPLVIVLSTLLIAALFTPVRRRVQRFIDRRFYRSRYDAQQVLARFAQRARDEVELERLSAELVGVVAETMQPEAATLWLKPAPLRMEASGRVEP